MCFTRIHINHRHSYKENLTRQFGRRRRRWRGEKVHLIGKKAKQKKTLERRDGVTTFCLTVNGKKDTQQSKNYRSKAPHESENKAREQRYTVTQWHGVSMQRGERCRSATGGHLQRRCSKHAVVQAGPPPTSHSTTFCLQKERCQNWDKARKREHKSFPFGTFKRTTSKDGDRSSSCEAWKQKNVRRMPFSWENCGLTVNSDRKCNFNRLCFVN